jgi:hypothetical protein
MVGATLPVMALTLTDDTGAAINLTGATLSLIIHNTQTQEDVAGAGTWAITNAAAGQATYTWASGDTATAGSFLLYVKATYSGGVAIADPIKWMVNAV